MELALPSPNKPGGIETFFFDLLEQGKKNIISILQFKGWKRKKKPDGKKIKVLTSSEGKKLQPICSKCGKSNCSYPNNCNGKGKKKKVTPTTSNQFPGTEKEAKTNTYRWQEVFG